MGDSHNTTTLRRGGTSLARAVAVQALAVVAAAATAIVMRIESLGGLKGNL